MLKSLGLNPKRLPARAPPKAQCALQALGFIKALYRIERRLRGKPPEERYRRRQAESVPVLDDLRVWLDEMRPQILPGSALGEALAYLDNHWSALVRYCDDGRYGMDTNGVENAIRPFCIGRRGWVFADTVAGAKSSANLYSLIQTAKANGLEPYAYLRHILTELPKATSLADIEALLPMRIASLRLNLNTNLPRQSQSSTSRTYLPRRLPASRPMMSGGSKMTCMTPSR